MSKEKKIEELEVTWQGKLVTAIESRKWIIAQKLIDERDNEIRNATIDDVEKILPDYDTGYGDLCVTIKEFKERLNKLKKGSD